LADDSGAIALRSGAASGKTHDWLLGYKDMRRFQFVGLPMPSSSSPHRRANDLTGNTTTTTTVRTADSSSSTFAFVPLASLQLWFERVCGRQREATLCEVARAAVDTTGATGDHAPWNPFAPPTPALAGGDGAGAAACNDDDDNDVAANWRRRCRVLVTGCGTSALAEDLYDDG
jgi:hypothetical protein